ncbi:MAG: cadmium-translocating P-type ATPase [Muribaculaceae bacterium]|nr:cadmium-translocating P-type ATPase [Muribaculaceae bacterium]
MSCTHNCHTSFGWTAQALSGALLVCAVVISHLTDLPPLLEAALYLSAVIPTGIAVADGMIRELRRGSIFNEFTLMLLACAGAFVIRQYPEGAAIILFYSIGEKLEDIASERARQRIRSLLDDMPDIVHTEERGDMPAAEVNIGETVRVLPGERVPLDGVLLSPADFDFSAITGESLPASRAQGEEIPSGAIPTETAVRLRVSRRWSESYMNRMVEMIETASRGKSRPDTAMRRITRWYTPAVMAAALILPIAGYIWTALTAGPAAYCWQEWLYRSLVLLVCSCPCALVVSIPLAYFAAIGRGSRLGILFKGSHALDALRHADTLYCDKTGTITTGRFRLICAIPCPGVTEAYLTDVAAALESSSSHPLAKAVCLASRQTLLATDIRTVPHGITGILDKSPVLVGSRQLMSEYGVSVPEQHTSGTEICVAQGGRLLGTLYLQDTLKPYIPALFRRLRHYGIRSVVILSGDNREAVSEAAASSGADDMHASMLPQDKKLTIENARQQGRHTIFIGDGINDAPALAAADTGIAVGSGTDLAIESADAVIPGDNLAAVASAIALSRRLHRVVTGCVAFAVTVKLLVMILGALGLATLWAAVFADTGLTIVTVSITLAALQINRKTDVSDGIDLSETPGT